MTHLRRSALLVAFAASCLAASAHASDTSSDDRYRDLERVVDTAQGRALQQDEAADIRAVAASGWLMGVYDMMVMNEIAGAAAPKICAGGPLTADTMARIYTKYMDAHPETHQMPDLAVAVISGTSAYPCSK